MNKTAVSFHSQGCKLMGDLYRPDDIANGETRAGILLCHGYTGVKDLYLPDNAATLVDEGYVVLTFDYKGWGDSEGPKNHLNPHGRVADAQAALTFLAMQPEVNADRLGVYGTSYGGATVVWLAAVDERVKCMVSVVGVGHGERWMRSVRRPDEWFDLLDRNAEDRERRLNTGESAYVERNDILLPDRQSLELATAARKDNPAAVSTLPFDYVDETLTFHPEWVVDKIAPRAALFITSDQDRLVPPEESVALYERAGEPKKLVTLKGYGHYEVYTDPAYTDVMRETVAWYQEHVPAR